MKISRDSGQDWRDLLGSDYIDPRELRSSSPLRDYVVVHLQELRDKGRSERTVPRYAAYLADFVTFMNRGKAAKVSDIDIRALKAYGSHLTRRGVQNGRFGGRGTISAATKNLHLIALRGLLKFGVLLDLAVPGPEKVELAKAVQPSPDARHLAEDRVERLLKACDTATEKGIRARALLEFLLATGCRVSEVVGLDRRQLELSKGARTPNDDGIRIVEEVTVFGKGSRYRRVYIHDRAREWLQKYLGTRKDNDKALFVTRRKSADGSYRMSVWTAEQIVRDAAKLAGLSEDVTPHWLRHAAITFWAKESLPSAQRLAGHRQIATTQRYLGSSDAELKAFYKRVSAKA